MSTVSFTRGIFDELNAQSSSGGVDDTERVFDAAARAGVSREDLMKRIKLATTYGKGFGNDPKLATNFALATTTLGKDQYASQLAKTAGYTKLTDFAQTLQMSYTTMNRDSRNEIENLQERWDNLQDSERGLLRSAFGLNDPTETWSGWAEKNGIDPDGSRDSGLFADVLSGADWAWDHTLGIVHHQAADLAGDTLHLLQVPLQFVTRAERAIYLDAKGGYDGWFGGEAWDVAGRHGGEGAYTRKTQQRLNNIVDGNPYLRDVVIELANDPGNPDELPDVIDKVVRRRLGISEDIDPMDLHGDARYREKYIEVYTAAAKDIGDGKTVIDKGFEHLVLNKISPGRQLANIFVHDKTSTEYRLLSGLGDATWTIFADPLLIAGKVGKAWRAGKYAISADTLLADLTAKLGDAEFLSKVDEVRKLRSFGDFDLIGDAVYRRGYLRELNDIAGSNNQIRLGIMITDAFDTAELTGERVGNLYRMMNAQRGTRGAQAVKDLVLYDAHLRGINIAEDGEKLLDTIAKTSFKPLEFTPTGRAGVDRIAKRGVDIHNQLGQARALRETIDGGVTTGGLRSLADFKGFFLAEEGKTSIAAGTWGDYGRGYLELPYLSRTGLKKAQAKLATENWLANWKGSVFDVYKGMNPDDFIQGARTIPVFAKSKARIADNIQKALNHLPREGTISLSTHEGFDNFRRFLMLGLDDRQSADFLGQFLTAYTPAAKRGVVFNGMAASMRGIGVAPETVGDIIAGAGDYTKLYSIAGHDIMSGTQFFGKDLRAAVFASQLADDFVAIPDYRDLLTQLEDVTKYQAVMQRAIRGKHLDSFMGKVWKPAVLISPRFAFRMAAEEGLAWIARSGWMSPIRKTIIDPIQQARTRDGELPWLFHPAGLIERRIRHFGYMEEFRNDVTRLAELSGKSEAWSAASLLKGQDGAFNPADIKFTKAVSNLAGDSILAYRNSLMGRVFGKEYHTATADTAWRHHRHGMSGSAYFGGIIGKDHMLAGYGRDANNLYYGIGSEGLVASRAEGGSFKVYIGADDGIVNDPYLMHVLDGRGIETANDHAASGGTAAIAWHVDPDTLNTIKTTIGTADPAATIVKFRKFVEDDTKTAEALNLLRQKRWDVDDPRYVEAIDDIKTSLAGRRIDPEIVTVLDKWGDLSAHGDTAAALTVRRSTLLDDYHGHGIPVPRAIEITTPHVMPPTEGGRSVVREPSTFTFDLSDPEWRAALDNYLPAVEDNTVRLWQVGQADKKWYADIDDAEIINAGHGFDATELRYVDVDLPTYETMRDATGNVARNQVRVLNYQTKTVPFQPLSIEEWNYRNSLIDLALTDAGARDELGKLIIMKRKMAPRENVAYQQMLRHYIDSDTGEAIIGTAKEGEIRSLVPMLPEDMAHQAVVHAYSNGKLGTADDDILAAWLMQNGYGPDEIDQYLQDWAEGAIVTDPTHLVPIGNIAHTDPEQAYKMADRWATFAKDSTGRNFDGAVGFIDHPYKEVFARRMSGDADNWTRLDLVPGPTNELGRITPVPDRRYVKVVTRAETEPMAAATQREMEVGEFLDELLTDPALTAAERNSIEAARDLTAGGRNVITDAGAAKLHAVDALEGDLVSIGARMWQGADPVELSRLREAYYRKVYDLLDRKIEDGQKVAGVWHLDDATISRLPIKQGAAGPVDGNPIIDALHEKFGDNWHLLDSAGNPRKISAEELDEYKQIARQAYDDVLAERESLRDAAENQAKINAGELPEAPPITGTHRRVKAKTPEPEPVTPPREAVPVDDAAGRGPNVEPSYIGGFTEPKAKTRPVNKKAKYEGEEFKENYDEVGQIRNRINDSRETTVRGTADAAIVETAGHTQHTRATVAADELGEPRAPIVREDGTRVEGSGWVYVARDRDLVGTKLSADAKQKIAEAKGWGAKFIVTDELEDLPTIQYLDEIGADYTIAHYGDQAKIDPKAARVTGSSKDLTEQQRAAVQRQATWVKRRWKKADQANEAADVSKALGEWSAKRDKLQARIDKGEEIVAKLKTAPAGETAAKADSYTRDYETLQRQLVVTDDEIAKAVSGRDRRLFQARRRSIEQQIKDIDKSRAFQASQKAADPDRIAKAEAHLAKLKAEHEDLLKADPRLTTPAGPAQADVVAVTTPDPPGGGKGTAIGDAKDQAMRDAADSAITETITKRKSSTVTTRALLPEPTEQSKIIMLARQNGKAHKGTDITDATKDAILAAHNRGARFLVGDMPGIDEPYVRYLDEIGARYTIYHTGKKPRIVPIQKEAPELVGFLAGEGETWDALNQLDYPAMRAQLAAIEQVKPATIPDPAQLHTAFEGEPYVVRQQWVRPGERWVRPSERAAGPGIDEIPDIGPHPADTWSDPHADIRDIDAQVQAAAQRRYGNHWRANVKDHADTFEIYPGTEGWTGGRIPGRVKNPNEKVITIGKTSTAAAEDAAMAAWQEVLARGTYRDGRTNYRWAAPVGNKTWSRPDAELLDVGKMRAGWYGPQYKPTKKERWQNIVNGFFDRYAHPILASTVRNPMFQEQLDRWFPQIEALLRPVLTNAEHRAAAVEVAAQHGFDDIDEVFRSLDTVHNKAVRDKTLSVEAFRDGLRPDLPSIDPIAARQIKITDETPEIVRSVMDPVLAAQDDYKRAFDAAKGAEHSDGVVRAGERVREEMQKADEQLHTLSVFWHDDDKALEKITEITYQRAYNELVPFIDDHHFKSVLSDDLRNLFPFWYAEEQFMKRWAKSMMKNPYAVRRVQLLHHGLKSIGFIQKDQYGQESYIVPGGGEFLNAFTHHGPFEWFFGAPPKHAVGVDVMGSVNYTLPGVGSDRIGIPGSSFLISLPLTFIGNFLPELAPANRAILGERTVTKGIVEQVFPSSVSKMMDVFLKDPNNSAEAAGTANNVLAQFEAAGLTPPEDASPAERELFLDRVTNWSRSMMGAKAILGMFTMATPQADFRNKFTPEFQGLLNHIGDYEDAFNMLIKKYPDATPYTVFKTETESGATLPASQQAMQWMDDNAGLIAAAPHGMPWLIPYELQKQTDNYDGIAYQQQLTNHARQTRLPKDYYNELKIKSASAAYFKEINKYELALATTDDPAAKADIEDQKRLWADAFKAQHPIFAADLESTDSKQRRESVIDEVEALVQKGGAFGADPQYIGFQSLMENVRGWQLRSQQFGQTDRDQEQKNQFDRDMWLTLDAYTKKRPEIRQFWLRNVSPLFNFNDVETAIMLGEAYDDNSKMRELVGSFEEGA